MISLVLLFSFKFFLVIIRQKLLEQRAKIRN